MLTNELCEQAKETLERGECAQSTLSVRVMANNARRELMEKLEISY